MVLTIIFLSLKLEYHLCKSSIEFMSSEDSCISASTITGKGAELELSVQVKGENEQHYTEIELSQTNSKI